MKKKYSIIGNPVAHSLSPTLHNYWFKKYKIEAEYDFKETNNTDIEKILYNIREKKLHGVNVTLPHKQRVIPFLDKIINDAKETKSVNTIYLDNNGNLVGDNTDVYGLQAAYLKEIVGAKENMKALIIGAGGVAPSIIYGLKKSGISKIFITNRTKEKSLFLKKNFTNLQILDWNSYLDETIKFDIIINATSLGLKGGENFSEYLKIFKKTLIYIDTIYNPIETKMIQHLKKSNIKTYNGLDMLIYQGQKSFYIWNKINPEIDNKLIELLMEKIK